MASNRGSYRRRNRAKPTSSSTRKSRVKSSTAPKPTSSTTRRQNAQQRRKSGARSRVTSPADRIKKNPVSTTPRGAQGPRTAPQQGPSQKVSGLQGSRKTVSKPAPKSATPRVSRVGPQIKQAARVKAANPGRAARAARIAKKSRGNALGLAAAVITDDVMNRGVADGTLKGKPVRSNPKKSVGKYNTRDKDGKVRSRAKVGAKKVGTIAQRFDKAYGTAKKAGKKTFTFRGKKYTTK